MDKAPLCIHKIRNLCLKLVAAAEIGNLKKVKWFTRKNLINAGIGDARVTALHQASQQGHLDVVEYLLQKKADINIEDYAGYTPLHKASTTGQYKVVEFLLRKGARVTTLSAANISPLFLASESGHADIVFLLLMNGAETTINNKSLNEGVTPLFQASQGGHHDIASFLLLAKANVNEQTNKGHTALCVASQNGHTRTVETLLAAKASVVLPDNNNQIPLLAASQNGHTTIVKLLLAAGHAAEIDAKAMVNTKNTDCGLSPLRQACYWGDTEIATLLINENADVNIQDVNDHTPLHVASKLEHLDMVKLLLQHKADPFLPDKGGAPALHYAENQEVNYHLQRRWLSRASTRGF